MFLILTATAAAGKSGFDGADIGGTDMGGTDTGPGIPGPPIKDRGGIGPIPGGPILELIKVLLNLSRK